MKYVAKKIVQSYELDSYNHVNNAVFLNYLELGRMEFLKAIGFDYPGLYEAGLYFYVTRVDIRYRASARLFDELSINPNNPPSTVRIAGDLVYREGPAPQAWWHRTRLEKPFIATFSSIKEASDILRGIQRNWAHEPVACFRRARLIEEKLPFVQDKPRAFPYSVPASPMGVWSLLDEHTLFASAETSSPFPRGILRFEEDHVNPPSRAYLKMYEALSWVDKLSADRGIPEGSRLPCLLYTSPSQRDS